MYSKDIYEIENIGNWSHAARDEFGTKYNVMMEKSVDTRVAAIKASSQNKQTGNLSVLEIKAPDTSKVDIVKDSKNGVEHTTYTPKSGSKMTSVVDGQTSIWTSSGNEKCTFAELSSKGDSSLLLISLENAYVYFEKNADGEWVSIEKDGYDRKIEELQDIAKQKGSQVAARDNLEANAEPNDKPEGTYAPKPTESKEEASPQANGATQKSQQMITTDPNTLDISNPDKSNVDEESGKDSKKYFPKDNKHFNEVKEGDTSIWRAGANEYCKFVRVSLKGNTPTEVSLNVRNNANNEEIHVKNFKKEGGLWQLISGRLTNSDSRRTND
ncbi:hypothetical protein BEWA_054000 [Theileria equi strain WA]|uniref:Uncharacterized protein n=1 Tax=Theileria equi strain WA TaxID=1537102 RepID=L1LDK0_THEEQ|nr:hypothetical protein BEWA_054000 [Theileria equi strain WA]EKX73344.1 hypothetical protein BEWA_054000 [Theileria equi strain WA]|eukprot:XP_004832796.1 hypothetical protein BEWA_054000 [Theileria equi strain WA]